MFFKQRSVGNGVLPYFFECAGPSGKPILATGFERRFNPMLALSREAFVDALTLDIPAQPPNMALIVEENLRGVWPEPGLC